MENYEILAKAIIKHQESIIGPLAWSEAKKVRGASVGGEKVKYSGEGKFFLESLVKQYETLFGQASVEACKDAIRPHLLKIGQIDLPQNLL